MSYWTILHPRFTHDDLGWLPDIIDAMDKRPIKEQLEERYAHGGGWRPMSGFKMNKETKVMRYPGDPPFIPCAQVIVGKETAVFYQQASLLAVIQQDGSFEVTRVD